MAADSDLVVVSVRVPRAVRDACHERAKKAGTTLSQRLADALAAYAAGPK